jgi:hypothetical protein
LTAFCCVEFPFGKWFNDGKEGAFLGLILRVEQQELRLQNVHVASALLLVS